MPITETYKKIYREVLAYTVDSSILLLKSILCMYHPFWFKKDQLKVQALLDSIIKVNAMDPMYAAKLNLKV